MVSTTFTSTIYNAYPEHGSACFCPYRSRLINRSTTFRSVGCVASVRVLVTTRFEINTFQIRGHRNTPKRQYPFAVRNIFYKRRTLFSLCIQFSLIVNSGALYPECSIMKVSYIKKYIVSGLYSKIIKYDLYPTCLRIKVIFFPKALYILCGLYIPCASSEYKLVDTGRGGGYFDLDGCPRPTLGCPHTPFLSFNISFLPGRPHPI